MGSPSYFTGFQHFNYAISVYDYLDYINSNRINERVKLVEKKRADVLNEVENFNTNLFSCRITFRDGRDGYQAYLEQRINLEDVEELSKLAENMQSCYDYSGECYLVDSDGNRKYYKPEITLLQTLIKKVLNKENLKVFIEREIQVVTKQFTAFAKKHKMGKVVGWGSVDYSWIKAEKSLAA